jgi:hypothetical protein
MFVDVVGKINRRARPNQSAEGPRTGHNILPTGPDLRPVRKLPLATGLPIILNSNQSSIDLTDAAANGRPGSPVGRP